MTGTSLRVTILGAASGIAEATARLYAKEGATLVLAGRRADRLEEIAADLRLRGAQDVKISVLDFAEADPAASLKDISRKMGGLDHVLVCYGTMSDQKQAETDLAAAREMIDVNFGSASVWILAAANLLERQGHGSLVVLGSVAGDRGRRSNYIYGAAKAGIGVLVQGIAHRFADKGPRAVVIKPGPTDTAMTAGMQKGGALWASADQVAAIVRKAADKGGPIVYAPSRWRLIMLIIRFLPAFIFNKLNF